jgi:hypothetical protein
MWRTLLVLTLATPLLVGWLHLEPAEVPARAKLRGIWDRVETGNGPPVQFYYFHTDDNGLFRFGSSALNHTEMFRTRWRWSGLEIAFRKTGETHVTRVRTKTDRNGRRVLILESDPRNGGKKTRYRRRADGGPRLTATPGAHENKDPFARMWMHRRELAKGATDFRIYQFRPAGENRHGEGWYHFGDFDEWTTESLQYYRGERGLHLRFVQRGEEAFTKASVREDRGQKVLRLDADPRYFGRGSDYVDAGPNLMTTEASAPLLLSTETLRGSRGTTPE